jgi:hypothetical protein
VLATGGAGLGLHDVSVLALASSRAHASSDLPVRPCSSHVHSGSKWLTSGYRQRGMNLWCGQGELAAGS